MRCWGWCLKITEIYHLFLTVLEARKFMIKAPADCVWRDLLPSSGVLSSLCLHMAEGVEEISDVPLQGQLILFLRALYLGPNHFPKAPPPNTFIVRNKLQHMNFGWAHSIYSCELFKPDYSLASSY